jgi:hypothetical protein
MSCTPCCSCTDWSISHTCKYSTSTPTVMAPWMSNAHLFSVSASWTARWLNLLLGMAATSLGAISEQVWGFNQRTMQLEHALTENRWMSSGRTESWAELRNMHSREWIFWGDLSCHSMELCSSIYSRKSCYYYSKVNVKITTTTIC